MNASVMTINQGRHWYFLHVSTRCEKKVVEALNQRIQLANLQDKFYKIVIPSEEVLEMRQGSKKRTVSRNMFPNYILLDMEMNEITWQLVCKTPNVFGFLGETNGNPTPVLQKQVDAIFKTLHDSQEKPRHKVLFQPGQKVKIITEPFLGFTGEIKTVDYEKKNRLQVSVVVFQRPILVELEFNQVQEI